MSDSTFKKSLIDIAGTYTPSNNHQMSCISGNFLLNEDA